MLLTDEAIIDGCIAGKRQERNMLYKKYASRLLGICLRYASSKAEAEDILLECFMKVYTNIGNFRKDGSFEGWLKRIAVNTSINHFRKNSKYQFVDIEQTNIASSENDKEEEEIGFSRLSKEQMLAIIQQLPDGYKMVFNLFVFEEYSHAEIGKSLGISESTSKTQLLKARKWLRNKLAEKTSMPGEKLKPMTYERG